MNIRRKNSFKNIKFINFQHLNCNSFELPNEAIINSLKKKQKSRTNYDIDLISKKLAKTLIIKKIIMENILSRSFLLQIINSYAYNVQYQFIEKGKFVFQEGEIGDRFFIVLKGRVNVFKKIKRNMICSGEKYLSVLVKLFKDKSVLYNVDLIEKIIFANKNIFKVNISDLDKLEEYIFKIRLFKLITSKIIDNEKIDNFIRANSRNRLDYLIEGEDSPAMLLIAIGEYKYCINDEEKQIKIYDYELINTIEELQHFGEIAIESHSRRTASVFSLDNTHLMYIDLDIYKELILKQKEIIINNEINFLMSFKIFEKIQRKNFSFTYIDLFDHSEVEFGEVFYKSDQPVERIYFIKEGEIEIFIKGDIESLNKKLSSMSRYNLKIPIELELNKEFKKVSENRLFLYSNNQILGLEEYFLNYPQIYSARACTSNIKIYSISTEKFKLILEQEKIHYNDKAFASLEMISKRLKTIIEGKIEKLINETKKNQRDSTDNEKKKTFFKIEKKILNSIHGFRKEEINNSKKSSSKNKLTHISFHNNELKSLITRIRHNQNETRGQSKKSSEKIRLKTAEKMKNSFFEEKSLSTYTTFEKNNENIKNFLLPYNLNSSKFNIPKHPTFLLGKKDSKQNASFKPKTNKSYLYQNIKIKKRNMFKSFDFDETQILK